MTLNNIVLPIRTANHRHQLINLALLIGLIAGLKPRLKKAGLFVLEPVFLLIDYLFKLLGNFELAILAVTVTLKIAFFPLANKSYASMAKMKAVQPQMLALRER